MGKVDEYKMLNDEEINIMEALHDAWAQGLLENHDQSL